MVSSMHSKTLIFAALFASAAAVGATLAPSTEIEAAQPAAQPGPYSAPPAHYLPPESYSRATAAPYTGAPYIASAVDRWRSLRQTDSLPFSSYAAFLTSYRGWPGEASMRKTAERAISPESTSPREVVSSSACCRRPARSATPAMPSRCSPKGMSPRRARRHAKPGSEACCRERTKNGC